MFSHPRYSRTSPSWVVMLQVPAKEILIMWPLMVSNVTEASLMLVKLLWRQRAMGECQKKMQRKCLLKLQKVSKSHDVHVGRCGGARCARWTLRYCLAHFKWTEAAVTYLAEQMKAATQEDEPTKPQSHPQTHRVTKPHTQKPINPQITHSETYKLTKLSSKKSRLSAENRPSRKRGARNVPTQAAEAQKPLQHARAGQQQSRSRSRDRQSGRARSKVAPANDKRATV